MPVLGRIMAGMPIRTLAFAQVRHPASPGLLDSSQWESESLQLVRTDTLRAMRDAEGRLTLTEVAETVSAFCTPASIPTLFSELDTFEKSSQPDSSFSIRRDVLKRLRALGYVR